MWYNVAENTKENGYWLKLTVGAESDMNSNNAVSDSTNEINSEDSVDRQNGLYRKKGWDHHCVFSNVFVHPIPPGRDLSQLL